MHRLRNNYIIFTITIIAISAGGCGEDLHHPAGDATSRMASVGETALQDKMSDDERVYLNGSGHVDCDGRGNFTPVVGDLPGQYPGCPGFYQCTLEHENSHIADFQAYYPTACQGKSVGYHPTWSIEINNWSECKAYTVSVNCLTRYYYLADKCQQVYLSILNTFRNRKTSYCG